MTKLKNTKKGMAKKALSVSLVAAMLATSNVPVWAAEDLFTDGSSDVAVEAPVAEEPAAEVEAFSSEPAEAPVVEEAEVNDVATYAASSDYDFSGVEYETNFDWGRTATPFTSGTIKDTNGKDVTSNLFYVWLLDGVEISGTSYAATTLTTTTINLKKEYVGSTLSVKFYENDDNDHTSPVGEISLGTIQAKDISSVMSINPIQQDVVYDGKTIEKTFKDNNLTCSEMSLNAYKKADNFIWSFSSSNGTNVGTVTVKATLKDSVAEATGYAGTLTQTYKIVAKTDIAIDDVDITVNNVDAGEYTGSTISMDPSCVTVKLKGTDVTLPIKAVRTDGNGVGENNFVITFDTEKLNATKNFNLAAEVGISTSDQKAEIKARDLSKGTASLNVTYKVSDMVPGFVVSPNRITLTGADGKSITADKIADKVNISLQKDAAQYQAVGTYNDAIIIRSIDTTGAVTGTVYADLVVTKKNFNADKATFKNAAELGLKTSAKDAMDSSSIIEYTGEDITFTESQLGSFLPDGTSDESDSNSFTITYANNKDASTSTKVASLTVTGKADSDYAGCSKTFYFKINPADVTATNDAKTTDVTTAVSSTVKGVEYIDNASAEGYKSAIGLTLKAQNDETDFNEEVETFQLAEGTDYDCTYEFVADDTGADLGPNDDPNTVGQYVKVTATLKNTNYVVATANVILNDVRIVGDAQKGTVTAYVKIVEKTIAGVDVTFDKDSYVYTGETITPGITVKSGDKTLKLGTDYSVSVRNGINVGTGTVVITALEGSGFRPGSQVTKDFQIVKANAEDVDVEITTANQEDIEYDGTAWTDKATDKHGALSFKVKLNGVDVSSQFKSTWGENIDAGKTAGKLTLTPNTNGTKNFDGIKEFTFEIKGEELTGILKIYNDNGKDITANVENGVYAYTGSPITFDDPRFSPDKSGLTEGEDYEIIYVNNVDAGTGYICVIGKGNYVGNEKNDIIVDGEVVQDNIIAKIDFDIIGSDFSAKDITIKNGVYASGLVVKPQVTVVADGKTLVEGIDYELEYDTSKAIDATEEANIRLTVKGIHGYNGVSIDRDSAGNYLVFGIDKFDLANATVTSDGETVTVRNGNVIVPSTEYTSEIADGKVTVTATDGNKNYTGTKTVDVDEEDIFVGAPVIKEVQVSGNKATVILEGEAEGATGYDYVISTVNDYQNGRLPDGIHRNQLVSETSYQYLDQGIYYAYCHAWVRDENGKKVFGEWSEIMPFSISAITPEKPTITSVKKSGRNVTVTWTQCDNAQGYDVVLGTAVRKVNGELRPVEYGKAVKKVGKNTYSVTFKSCPKGATFYAGLHAWNRTSETGVKVFSPWSDSVKVTI